MTKGHSLGIDVGTGTIKALSGTRDDSGNVIIDSIGVVSTAGFDKGVITDIKALARAVRQAVDCTAVAGEPSINCAYLGIGGLGFHSFNCTGSVAPAKPDKITHEDIERACRAAVLAKVPEDRHVLHTIPVFFRVDGVQYDEPPLAVRGHCLEVDAHIVTVPAADLEALVGVIENSGINISGIIANIIADWQCFMPALKESSGMLLDIGAGTADMLLYHQGRIYFSASLPLGGNYVTKDVMQGLDISQSHAEEIKRYYSRLDQDLRGQSVLLDCNDYGTTDKQVSYDFLSDIIESRVEEIVSLLHEYVKPILREENIREIILTGGCALMPSMNKALADSFGKPVRIGKPAQLSAEYAHPGNTACYGILCHSIDNVPEPAHAALQKPDYLQSLLKKIKRFF
jgi:cell division protein FtsA